MRIPRRRSLVRKGDIMFRFKAHPTAEASFSPKHTPSGVRAIVFENAHGSFHSKLMRHSDLKRKGVRRIYADRPISRLNELHAQNVLTIEGESTFGLLGRFQLWRLRRLNGLSDRAEENFLRNKSFSNFRKQVECSVALQKYRHQLIRSTVKRLIAAGELPVYGEYGTMHSILRREFQKEGIPMKSKVGAQAFPYDIILLRKLVMGNSLRQISSELLKKAYISSLFGFEPAEKSRLTREDDQLLRIYSIMQRTLLDDLTPKMLDEIIEKIQRGENPVDRLCQLAGIRVGDNGLIIIRDLIAHARKNPFYRRLLDDPKMKSRVKYLQK